MKKIFHSRVWFGFVFVASFFVAALHDARGNIIEDQLKEIGTIPDEEVVVVQRKYTRKNGRLELTPVQFGGVPFGTIRRTLFGGASLTYHLNDWLGLELPNFIYTKNFFSSFTADINTAQVAASRPEISIEEQRLLFFLTGGVQLTPFYGKLSTFSEYIAYIEPFFSLGGGLAKTETSNYLLVYPGVGFRLFFKEWFSMRFDFRDYIYVEHATTDRLRNNYAFTISLSFWLPKMPTN